MKRSVSYVMIPCLLASLALPVLAATSDWTAITDTMRTALTVLLIITAALILASVVITVSLLGSAQQSINVRIVAIALYVTTILVAAITIFCFFRYQNALTDKPVTVPPTPTDGPTAGPTEPPTQKPTDQPTDPPTEKPTQKPTEPTVPPTEDPRLSFEAVSSAGSDPDNWGVEWEIIVNDEIVSSYTRKDPIHFGDGADYFALPGIATFRGNNYRSTSTYGTAEVKEEKLYEVWRKPIGSYNDWSGSGWTGQPLLVQWDDETKAIMNLYADKKNKDGLVEVIYATLDGYIYFYDLEDGSRTRDPIWMGENFKGAGAVDPRGYPLLYLGGGIAIDGYNPSMYVVSLIDGSILMDNFYYDEYDQRGWVAFDSSPLVDAETDTLIYPCENGILYTIKLNTNYDKKAGTISIDPDPSVKTRYRNDNYYEGRYLGYEASLSIVDHWMYLSENGGMFYCVDINTMELVWAQDTKDDSNQSPVFEWDEEGNGYIYTAPSLHWTANWDGTGTISIYKLDAATGEIIWEVPIDCVTVSELSGGVQSTPLLGKDGTELEGLIIYSIARSPSYYNGQLIAIDRETGEVVWKSYAGNYCWSSPTAFYTDDGRAYIFIADVDGDCKLFNAKGERLAVISLGGTTEASPVVFNDMLIIGTRYGNVHCIKIY